MQDVPRQPLPPLVAHTAPPHLPECTAHLPWPRPRSAIEECCAADFVSPRPPCSDRSNRRKPKALLPELQKIPPRHLLLPRTGWRNSPRFLHSRKIPLPQSRG